MELDHDYDYSMPLLKDVYVCWNDEDVWIAPKANGKPTGNYFDADDFDYPNIHALYLDWLMALTVGHWEIKPRPFEVVNDVLIEIYEFGETVEAEQCEFSLRLARSPERPTWMGPGMTDEDWAEADRRHDEMMANA